MKTLFWFSSTECVSLSIISTEKETIDFFASVVASDCADVDNFAHTKRVSMISMKIIHASFDIGGTNRML